MTDINELAKWMIANNYATGHGDTVEDLARELIWQVAEECAKLALAETTHKDDPDNDVWMIAYNHVAHDIAAVIRAKFCGKGE